MNGKRKKELEAENEGGKHVKRGLKKKREEKWKGGEW
jgi:hypothetical protein